MERLRVAIAMKRGALLPSYVTAGSAGMDLAACIERPVVLKPFERAIIPTGIYLMIPEDYEAEIRPRSGIAYRFGITILNTPGTIDSDYRGEIKVLLINLGDAPFTINNGDRIAQMVFKGVKKAEWVIVETLPLSRRGEGGFGSTGINNLDSNDL